MPWGRGDKTGTAGRSGWRFPPVAIALVAIAATGALAPTAGAATINVGIVADELNNGGLDDTGCSLREAVKVANENADFGCNPVGGFTGGPDTIVLQSGLTYTLTRHGPPGVDDTNVNGDLDIDGQTIIRAAGAGLATINADSNTIPGPPDADRDRAIHVESTAGAVTLERLRITGGFVPRLPGGGGILNEAPLTVISSEIVDNGTRNPDAAFEATFGGGIFTTGALASLTMLDSTVAGNVATAGSGFSDAIGGGIAVRGAPAVTLTNSTISGNSAVTGPGGGGFGTGFVGGAFLGDNQVAPPTANLTNVTVTGNTAVGDEALIGGIQVRIGMLTGNLIAGNTDPTSTWPDCVHFPGDDPPSGGGNLIGERGDNEECDFAAPDDLVGADGAPINPMLGNLLNNGGSTRTHALNPGSPALNRGGSCPATDQRGLFRFSAPPCDAGALEVGAAVNPPAPPEQQPATPGPTGARAAALAKCKKKKSKKKRRKCRAKANKLPV